MRMTMEEAREFISGFLAGRRERRMAKGQDPDDLSEEEILLAQALEDKTFSADRESEVSPKVGGHINPSKGGDPLKEKSWKVA